MRILPLIVIVACLACHVLARPQEEAEAKPAPARGLLKRGPPNKGKVTTTTTPAPAQDDAEYDEEGEEEPADNVEPQEPSTEAPPSSTEGKKLVGSGVRPFRSNTDLLETLKKRRAQAAEARHANPPSAQDSQVDVASKSSFSKKRFNTATRETKPEEAQTAAKTGKSRFTRPSSKVNLEIEEEQVEPTPSPRTGRTFARRGN